MNRKPIGVFDSGVGGLTTVRQLLRLLPNEKIVYFGDTARVPYGTKSKKTIVRFTTENVLFLLEKKVKLIVIACNTSSSLALPAIKKHFNIPMVGVIEPAVKAALRISRSGRIGVIGTRATIDSKIYENQIKQHNRKIEVFTQACPLFVPFVEEGWLDNAAIRNVAETYLSELRKKKIDTLILGCTHYPLLKKIIAQVLGKGVVLIDSGQEAALSVSKILEERNLSAPDSTKVRSAVFFVSDEPSRFQRLGRKFLKNHINNIQRVSR
ncbi:MAG: glutamate racemase [Candidatus Omnitrophota bacterium]